MKTMCRVSQEGKADKDIVTAWPEVKPVLFQVRLGMFCGPCVLSVSGTVSVREPYMPSQTGILLQRFGVG